MGIYSALLRPASKVSAQPEFNIVRMWQLEMLSGAALGDARVAFEAMALIKKDVSGQISLYLISLISILMGRDREEGDGCIL